jgi:histone deacetylase 11
VVDLDAHQGNGVARCFLHDDRVRIFDMHRPGSYLRDDRVARARIDAEVILPAACGTGAYLALLRDALPRFLDGPAAGARLIVYNAGTDVLAGDIVGYLWVSTEGVRLRDAFVLDQARARGVPLTAVPSGGYTKRSRRHVHALARAILLAGR